MISSVHLPKPNTLNPKELQPETFSCRWPPLVALVVGSSRPPELPSVLRFNEVGRLPNLFTRKLNGLARGREQVLWFGSALGGEQRVFKHGNDRYYRDNDNNHSCQAAPSLAGSKLHLLHHHPGWVTSVSLTEADAAQLTPAQPGCITKLLVNRNIYQNTQNKNFQYDYVPLWIHVCVCACMTCGEIQIHMNIHIQIHICVRTYTHAYAHTSISYTYIRCM